MGHHLSMKTKHRMIETPRTDALHVKLVKLSEGQDWIAGKDYVDMAALARQLERELSVSCANISALVRSKASRTPPVV